MASTRESTPLGEEDETSSLLLTPNSKIKALLARLEEPQPLQNSASARDILLASMKKPVSPGSVRLGPPEDINSDKMEGEEWTDSITPKNRIVSRMQVNPSSEELSSSRDHLRAETDAVINLSIDPTLDAIPSDDYSPDGENQSTNIISRQVVAKKIRARTPKSSMTSENTSRNALLSPRKALIMEHNLPHVYSESMSKDHTTKAKFMNLKKKRPERRARKSEAYEKKLDQVEEYQESMHSPEETNPSDKDLNSVFTPKTRTSRKASKKALEDMNRETQRIMRQQQLTHKPVIKKKITKESLLSKFNFKFQCESESLRPTSSSSAANESDLLMQSTPPTSPVKFENDAPDFLTSAPSYINDNDRKQDSGKSETSEEVPRNSLRCSSISILPTNQKLDVNQEQNSLIPKVSKLPQKFGPTLSKTKLSDCNLRIYPDRDDSDSELEIIEREPKVNKGLDSVFDRIPAKQSREADGFHVLKILAQVKSPPKNNNNKNQVISTAELQVSLQQRARRQAAIEREKRLELLKAKGINIQTNEERERDQADIDDMLMKARAEAEELRKREKAAKKQQNDCSNENDSLDYTTEDEDWKEDENSVSEEVDGLDSIHEEESDTSGDEFVCQYQEEEQHIPFNDPESVKTLVELSPVKNSDGFKENMNDVSEERISGISDEDLDQEEEINPCSFRKSRQNRKLLTISDDEESNFEERNLITSSLGTTSSTNQPLHQTSSPVVPISVFRSATKTFIPGLPLTGPAGLGLTQIFSGTMDDTQVSLVTCSSGTGTQHYLENLRQAPSPPISPLFPRGATPINRATESSQISRILESQTTEVDSLGSQLHPIKLSENEVESLIQDTQVSQSLEPTQDVGFAHLTPNKVRFVELPQFSSNDYDYEGDTEVKHNRTKRKLYRKAPQVTAFSDEETNEEEETCQKTRNRLQVDDNDIETNVFDVLCKFTKQQKNAKDVFDKKTSRARDMFNEQAEESDDEYAGLGGLSDDLSSGEDDEFIKDMIDDEGGEDVDQGENAAFFADRERVNDEKQIQKLYNDITRGMFRRKRGAEFELSDSDDDEKARRHRKRQEFAKMRKALLADERVKKIASNPKSQAFLNAIEDREDNGDKENLFFDSEEQEDDCQLQPQAEMNLENKNNLTSISTKISTNQEINQSSRYSRWAASCKKPSSLSEIRHSLSTLLENPNSLELAEPDSESDESLDIENHDSISGKNSEHKSENATDFLYLSESRKSRTVVIDRLSLKRQASTSSKSNDSRLAFCPTTSVNSFTVPPLLRRTTTSSIASSTKSTAGSSESMSTERAAGLENSNVKKGGTWGSGVNYFIRENERRAKMIKAENRREKRLVENAISRRNIIGSLLKAGSFE